MDKVDTIRSLCGAVDTACVLAAMLPSGPGSWWDRLDDIRVELSEELAKETPSDSDIQQKSTT